MAIWKFASTASPPTDRWTIWRSSKVPPRWAATIRPLYRYCERAPLPSGHGPPTKKTGCTVVKTEGQNVTKRHAGVLTLTKELDSPQTTLRHVFYASPVAARASEIEEHVRRMLHG